MDVIYGLIPAMIFIGLVMVGVLIWAIKSGQYDDFEGDANRILMDDDLKPSERKARHPTEEEKKDSRHWPDAD